MRTEVPAGGHRRERLPGRPQLIALGAVSTEGLITHRVPFEHAAEAYALITDTPQNTIKVVLTYDS